jgi:hypothetical protein
MQAADARKPKRQLFMSKFSDFGLEMILFIIASMEPNPIKIINSTVDFLFITEQLLH